LSMFYKQGYGDDGGVFEMICSSHRITKMKERAAARRLQRGMQ